MLLDGYQAFSMGRSGQCAGESAVIRLLVSGVLGRCVEELCRLYCLGLGSSGYAPRLAIHPLGA